MKLNIFTKSSNKTISCLHRTKQMDRKAGSNFNLTYMYFSQGKTVSHSLLRNLIFNTTRTDLFWGK